jgi:hypothetical protein
MINNLLCDSEIIHLLKQNNNIVWGFIHAKYSTMMYSCIFKSTDNQTLADEILKNTFAKLKMNSIGILQSGSLGLFLLDQARNTIIDSLKT